MLTGLSFKIFVLYYIYRRVQAIPTYRVYQLYNTTELHAHAKALGNNSFVAEATRRGLKLNIEVSFHASDSLVCMTVITVSIFIPNLNFLHCR